jgi:hypothetical protein|tara:strand:+ start:93 stop:569 length:477 start_codon:yes stop_codon:yes gene_type:complete
MSRKSRRRNIVLGTMLGLAGASKLGLLGSKAATGLAGEKMAAARRALTSNQAMRGVDKVAGKGPLLAKATAAGSGITKVAKTKSPGIIIGADGSITKGGEKFANKKIFSETMKKRRGDKSLKEFLNKFILGPKTQINSGKTIKARGGGMARMKPTKLY